VTSGAVSVMSSAALGGGLGHGTAVALHRTFQPEVVASWTKWRVPKTGRDGRASRAWRWRSIARNRKVRRCPILTLLSAVRSPPDDASAPAARACCCSTANERRAIVGPPRRSEGRSSNSPFINWPSHARPLSWQTGLALAIMRYFDARYRRSLWPIVPSASTSRSPHGHYSGPSAPLRL
jgi:hypothetical protein